MKKFFLLTVACLSLSACTAPDRSKTTLEDAAYSDVRMGGYNFFECGRDDVYATSFTAKNALGKTVRGTVCCGWFKGCTIRH